MKYVFMSSFPDEERLGDETESVAANRFVNAEDFSPHAGLSGLPEMSDRKALLQLRSGIDPERAIEMRDSRRSWIVDRMQVPRSFEADPIQCKEGLTRKMDAIVPRVPTEFREFKPFGRPVRHHPSMVRFFQLGDSVPVYGPAIDDHRQDARQFRKWT